jgi:hypothetical protein
MQAIGLETDIDEKHQIHLKLPNPAKPEPNRARSTIVRGKHPSNGVER